MLQTIQSIEGFYGAILRTKWERRTRTNIDLGWSVGTSCKDILILFASQRSWNKFPPRKIVFLKTPGSRRHGIFNTMILRSGGRKVHRNTLIALDSRIDSGMRWIYQQVHQQEVPEQAHGRQPGSGAFGFVTVQQLN